MRMGIPATFQGNIPIVIKVETQYIDYVNIFLKGARKTYIEVNLNGCQLVKGKECISAGDKLTNSKSYQPYSQ